MAVQIGAKPDSGFDDPIGMLKDCHRRIEHFLHILSTIVDRAQAGGQSRALASEESGAVESALHYFRLGGQRHNADEEDSLFPRLRADWAISSFEEIAGLQTDHRAADDLHTQVEKLYSRWIENGKLSPEDLQHLLAATQRLSRLYAEHIKIEEEIVFPHAAEVLDQKAIADIGQEFRARRQ
jgi:hemerythrin-like domain-containing protein